MPAKSRVQVIVDAALCRRCQSAEPVLTVRSEPLCTPCFVKYVSTKIVKRMESFRVRNSDPANERTLLVPLSFGSCSTALLHVLSQHRQGQVERTGRPGYKLHVLHVAGLESDLDHLILAKVQCRYPDHAYSSLRLADAFTADELRHVLSLPSDDPLVDERTSPLDLSTLLQTLRSATSRADVAQIVLRKAIVGFARANDCEAVLWGDSTTRLAERTLAETAKGRGHSLPWMMADGKSPHDLPFYFPVRDLLSKELGDFAGLTEPPLHEITLVARTKPAVSTKNTTIDELMKQYFESVEREFPSIVANVVKTTSKLRSPNLNEMEGQCELCAMPLDGEAPEKSRLCYGCIRTLSSNIG